VTQGPGTDGFQQFLLALREEVVAFRKPVAYVAVVVESEDV
jgi:hypothetical protein